LETEPEALVEPELLVERELEGVLETTADDDAGSDEPKTNGRWKSISSKTKMQEEIRPRNTIVTLTGK